MCHRFVARTLALAALVLLTSAPRVLAGPYISPFVGFDFGQDSRCPSTSSCDNRTSNWGVTFGSSNVLLGFEEEFGYAKDFFGPESVQSGSLLTLMSNLVVGPRIAFVRPFGVIGIGLMKTHVDLSLNDIATSDTSFGWDVGGGLEISGAHFGIRGDVRYFHGFQDIEVPLVPVDGLKLDYGRATAGLVLRF
jgi:opacity protein-like surface antigen